MVNVALQHILVILQKYSLTFYCFFKSFKGKYFSTSQTFPEVYIPWKSVFYDVSLKSETHSKIYSSPSLLSINHFGEVFVATVVII